MLEDNILTVTCATGKRARNLVVAWFPSSLRKLRVLRGSAVNSRPRKPRRRDVEDAKSAQRKAEIKTLLEFV